jgi:hypothetical protein
MISRGTTLGHLDDNGKRMDSAIYFYDFGLGVADLPLSATRLAELRGPVGHPNKPYNAVVRRDNWVEHLESYSHSGRGLTDEDIDFLIQWATTERISASRVDGWIQKLTQSHRPDVP